MTQLPQIVKPEHWYMGFWLLMLIGWYFATRYGVLWALKTHTLWKASQGL